MRSLLSLGGLAAALVLAAGCTERSTPPLDAAGEIAAARAAAENPHALTSNGRNFTAPVRGAAEVPPVASTAIGSAGFHLSADGQRLVFSLLIGRLNNVTQAHIHLAPAGQNGPVVVWLYPSGPPPVPIPGEFNGILGEGVITAASLVGPLAGQPLSVLVDALRNGGAYVNVHTSQFPGGEIRGQITHLEVID